jgi:glycosyltransferase involved in cell wall biosynthesis
VAILLCTYNGGRFLGAQLDTLMAQSGHAFSLWVSDDGSSDDTLAIVERYRSNFSELSLLQGPGQGCVANFLSLVADPAVEGEFYAYCDQDDLWYQGKLQRALAALDDLPAGIPGLYCARTRLIDEDGVDLGMSPLFARQPGFQNALLQNIGGGNTMVMNAAARSLLAQAGPLPVVSHDWWTYMLVSGAGGQVIYDPEPVLSYRQHSSNVIGSNTGWLNRLYRYLKVLDNRSRGWNELNIAALQQVRHLLTEENCEVLDVFSDARQRSLLPRLRGVRRSGVYLQTPVANLIWV